MEFAAPVLEATIQNCPIARNRMPSELRSQNSLFRLLVFLLVSVDSVFAN